MALDQAAISAVYSTVLSHVSATGQYGAVNGHEPKSTPPVGAPTAGVWAAYLGPAVGSGLAVTSALLVVQVRTYSPMLAQTREAADAMDPRLLTACSAVIGALAADLDLGGQARCVDVRGMSGRRMEAQAGYVEMSGKLQRILDLSVPILINDAWVETP
jgi:hypothetical protein